MRFSSKLSVAFVTLVALAAPALSSVAQIETDLNNIKAAATTLDNDLKNWDGDFFTVITISTDAQNLSKLTQTAVTDVKATAPFSESDAQAIIAVVTAGIPILNQTLSDFISKKSDFAGLGVVSTVESGLQTLQTDVTQLANALQANAPADLIPQVVSIQAAITASISAAIQAFSS